MSALQEQAGLAGLVLETINTVCKAEDCTQGGKRPGCAACWAVVMEKLEALQQPNTETLASTVELVSAVMHGSGKKGGAVSLMQQAEEASAAAEAEVQEPAQKRQRTTRQRTAAPEPLMSSQLLPLEAQPGKGAAGVAAAAFELVAEGVPSAAGAGEPLTAGEVTAMLQPVQPQEDAQPAAAAMLARRSRRLSTPGDPEALPAHTQLAGKPEAAVADAPTAAAPSGRGRKAAAVEERPAGGAAAGGQRRGRSAGPPELQAAADAAAPAGEQRPGRASRHGSKRDASLAGRPGAAVKAVGRKSGSGGRRRASAPAAAPPADSGTAEPECEAGAAAESAADAVAPAGGQTPLLRPADAAQAEAPAAERQAAAPAEAPAAMDIDCGAVHAELSAAPPLAVPDAELVLHAELAPLDPVAGAMAAAGALSEQLGGGGGEDSGSEGNAPHLSGSTLHRAVAAVDAQVEQLEALSGPQDKPISNDGPAAATSAARAAAVPVAPAAAPSQVPVPRLQQQQLLQDEEQQRLEAVIGDSPQEQAPEQQRRRQSGGGGSISGKRRLGALRGTASQVTLSAPVCFPACLPARVGRLLRSPPAGWSAGLAGTWWPLPAAAA